MTSRCQTGGAEADRLIFLLRDRARVDLSDELAIQRDACETGPEPALADPSE